MASGCQNLDPTLKVIKNEHSPEPQTPKKRGKCKLFELDKVFDSGVEINSSWSKKFRNTTLQGEKQYYYCNVSKKCPAEMYIFYRYDGIVERHVCGEHKHEDERLKSGTYAEQRSKIADNIKDEILRLYESGTTKPNLIIQNLHKKGIVLKDTQLYVFLNRYKRKKMVGKINIKKLCTRVKE